MVSSAPPAPFHNTGPKRAFGWTLGEGVRKQRGGINRGSGGCWFALCDGEWWFFFHSAAKIGMQCNPINPFTTQAPCVPSNGCWEKGRAGRGKVLKGLEGGAGRDDASDGNNFFWCIVCVVTHEFRGEKTKCKNRVNAVIWASFAPLRLHCRNCRGAIHICQFIAWSEGGGGRSSTKLAGERTSLAKTCFFVFGFGFRKRGKLPQKEKKKCDSKTTTQVVVKNKGCP